MTTTSLRRPAASLLLLTLLTLAVFCPPCAAQTTRGLAPGDRVEALDTMPSVVRAEIAAFTSREVGFGLFVLLVGALGVVVMLPSGRRARSTRQRGRSYHF